MHIPDGFVSPSICITGYAITGGVTWYCLQQIKKDSNPQQKIPRASLFTAAFFVASLIHIPIPPASIHLVLNGVMGAILGYYSFLAILIGLFFQTVMFQHGGLSTLGINGVIMGIPALVAYHIFRINNQSKRRKKFLTQILAFCAGAGSLILSATLFTVIIITNITSDLDAQAEINAIYLSLISYVIQAMIEGVFTMMLISFLEQVKPEILRQ